MMQVIFESVFDTGYLIAVITLGFIMALSGRSKAIRLFGLMTLILGFGDAFHLVPRVYALAFGGYANPQIYAYLGFGKLVTSVTMTVFYILLFFIIRMLFNKQWRGLTALILILAAVRIALCFFPQNMWYAMDAPVSWGIYRNIPFVLIGIIVTAAYYVDSSGAARPPHRNIPVAIMLSFLFYIPVVIWAKALPVVGALMIPKTAAYIWLVLIGFKMYRDEKYKTH